MQNISFEIVTEKEFPLIADWYLNEWKIPFDKTIQNLKQVNDDPFQLQVLMRIDGRPVSCGGVYHHVGLLDREPRFRIYKNWLALVYTIPSERKKGYGAILCENIQERSKKMGLERLYLFTDTAEKLYKRLGWSELERLSLVGRNIVVMERDL
ncbi:MAG: GNAT family N-acetyltransferase [Bacteroidia bacterium]|nr:GNAT family N-acetyltransferase [Bacteroidia bacterium]